MDEQEILYAIATTQLKGVGPINARLLLEALGSFRAIYENRASLAALVPEISPRMAQLLSQPWDSLLARAEAEWAFIEKSGIRPLCLSNEDYPSRLRECVDAPTMLYYKGSAALNARRVISVVGTRHCTEYGKEICGELMRDLQQLSPDVLIVSGLAYGVDAHAHNFAMVNHLPTVGVLAHGLDRIYPTQHRSMAVKMIAQGGGLLTEYLPRTTPDRHNFVSRNRIVAGMADAVVVVESGKRGGSLITAEIAQGYSRDVFAFPGRISDPSSGGCLALIRQNRASLITSAHDLVEAMNWSLCGEPSGVIQRELFPELSPEEELVVKQLQGSDGVQINRLVILTNISISRLTSMLFELEMKGVVKALKGGVYKLIG